MGKFSVQKSVGSGKTTVVPAKKPAEVEERPLKRMKLSDLVEEEGPKPQTPNVRNLSAKNPVQCVIYKYTDCAGSDLFLWKPFLSKAIPRDRARFCNRFP